MNINETGVTDFMESVRAKYFPDLQTASFKFEVVYDKSFDGVMGQAVFGLSAKVVLHYSDARILDPRYRMGLVPVIAHELAHYIDPVDPERVMRDRLPAPLMALWEDMIKEGYAKCSMNVRHHMAVEIWE